MRTAIVTGASGNLGHAVIRKFLSAGYRVIGTLIPNDPAVADSSDKNFSTEIVDLTNDQETAALISSVVKRFETIDAAVLTVGGFTMGTIAETSLYDISKQLRLNFETAYNTAKPIFNQMMTQGFGRIFLVGSKPGLDMKNSKGMVAYGLSKSLIFRLAELMNEEAKGKNLVVAVIVPSTIDTPQNRQSMPKADFSKWVKPADIADVISFYSSEAATALREPLIKVYGGS